MPSGKNDISITTPSKPWHRHLAGVTTGWKPVPHAVVVIVLCGLPTGCDKSSSRNEEKAVAVIISGDTNGWIVPCGCVSNQSGGLPRRGTFVAQVRKEQVVVVADAGGAPGGTSDYDRFKFESILKGEMLMGVVAHNLGGPEAALGVEELQRLEAAIQAPFVSANLRDELGQLVTRSTRTVEAGGLRLLFTGVLSRRYENGAIRIDDPIESLLTVARRSGDPYDTMIVLAYLPEEELRSLAAALPEADVIVGGPTGQSIAPLRVGPTLLASATNKGRFVAYLEVIRQGATVQWSGDVVEMSERFQDDPRQQSNLDEYRRLLAARDFSAARTGLVVFPPVDAPAGHSGYAVAGTPSCKPCHTGEWTSWTESKHATEAWRTLESRSAHVDPFCQQCHTTGYGLPQGFVSAKRSKDRTAVGCESCHGPSRAHVWDPDLPTPFRAADQCVRCHDRENSPQFEYESYWSRIVHGKPEPAPSRSRLGPSDDSSIALETAVRSRP